MRKLLKMELVSNWMMQMEISIYIYNKMHNTELDLSNVSETEGKALDNIAYDLKWYGRSKKELKHIPLEFYEMAVDEYGQEDNTMWLEIQKKLYEN